MRYLTLREYETQERVALSVEERDALRTLVRDIAITPSLGQRDTYDIRPDRFIGAVQIGDLAIDIQPKLPTRTVFFMLSYALGNRRDIDEWVDYGKDASLVELVVASFVGRVKQALRLGVLQGYHREEDALATIRGRIDFSVMMKRFSLIPPIDVAFDDFTEDIDENRILKAAISRLRQLRIRHDESRRALRQFDLLFASVADVQYHPGGIPNPTVTRLNKRYEAALRLARIILRGASFEMVHGMTAGRAVLFDMAKVVEDFLVTALRDALSASERTLVQGNRGHALYLDEGREIALRPDISWWDGDDCRFVADVKYKTTDGRPMDGDVYQMLAYLIATDLPVGTLIYAGDSSQKRTCTFANSGKSLQVEGIDLAQRDDQILGQVQWCAKRMAVAIRRKGHAIG